MSAIQGRHWKWLGGGATGHRLMACLVAFHWARCPSSSQTCNRPKQKHIEPQRASVQEQRNTMDRDRLTSLTLKIAMDRLRAITQGSGSSSFGRGVTRRHTPTIEKKKCEQLKNWPEAPARATALCEMRTVHLSSRQPLMLDALILASMKAKRKHINGSLANATKMHCSDIGCDHWELLTPGGSMLV